VWRFISPCLYAKARAHVGERERERERERARAASPGTLAQALEEYIAGDDAGMGVTRRSLTPDVNITLPLACPSDFGDGPWEYTTHERSIMDSPYAYSCEELVLQTLVHFYSMSFSY
jgi:hypothetical protein